MKDWFLRMVSLQETVPPAVTTACAGMRKAAEMIDRPNDISQFIAQNRSGTPKPPEAKYEPYVVRIIPHHRYHIRPSHSILPIISYLFRDDTDMYLVGITYVIATGQQDDPHSTDQRYSTATKNKFYNWSSILSYYPIPFFVRECVVWCGVVWCGVVWCT